MQPSRNSLGPSTKVVLTQMECQLPASHAGIELVPVSSAQCLHGETQKSVSLSPQSHSGVRHKSLPSLGPLSPCADAPAPDATLYQGDGGQDQSVFWRALRTQELEMFFSALQDFFSK